MEHQKCTQPFLSNRSAAIRLPEFRQSFNGRIGSNGANGCIAAIAAIAAMVELDSIDTNAHNQTYGRPLRNLSMTLHNPSLESSFPMMFCFDVIRVDYAIVMSYNMSANVI